MNEENKNLEETIKHYIDIAAERFDDKIKALVEGQDLIMDKLERVDDGQRKLTDRFNSLEVKVNSLEVKVNSLETKVDLLIEDMDYVKGALIGSQDRFGKLENEMENKVEKEAFLGHETRISALENRALA